MKEENKKFGEGIYGKKIDKGHCPNCNAPPKDHELRNHSLMWHDGDVHCSKCGTYVRMWDAG